MTINKKVIGKGLFKVRHFSPCNVFQLVFSIHYYVNSVAAQLQLFVTIKWKLIVCLVGWLVD